MVNPLPKVKSFLKTSARVAVLGIIITLFAVDPNFDPPEFEVPPSQFYTGPLAPNQLVEDIGYLASGQLHGAESMVIDGETIYTTSMSCEALKIVGDKVIQRISLIPERKCEDCCFPLGIRRWRDEKFALVDGRLGLFVIDYADSSVKHVLPSNIALMTRPQMMADDLTFIDEDTLIFTDYTSTCAVPRHDWCVINGVRDSRLVQVDLRSGAATVILEDMPAMNGIQAHPDGQSLITSATAYSKMLRYYYRGEKNGTMETFADQLPGIPDNVRLAADGRSFWVSLYFARDGGQKTLFQKMGPHRRVRMLMEPLMRRLPSKALYLYAAMGTSRGSVYVELDLDGNIVNSLHDPHGELIGSTQVTDNGTHLFFGSIHRPHIPFIKKPWLQ